MKQVCTLTKRGMYKAASCALVSLALPDADACSAAICTARAHLLSFTLDVVRPFLPPVHLVHTDSMLAQELPVASRGRQPMRYAGVMQA